MEGRARQGPEVAGSAWQSVYGGGVRSRRPRGDRLGRVRRTGDVPGRSRRAGAVQADGAHDARTLATGVSAAAAKRLRERLMRMRCGILIGWAWLVTPAGAIDALPDF